MGWFIGVSLGRAIGRGNPESHCARITFWGYLPIDLAEIQFVLLLFSFGNSGEPHMQNVRPTDLAPAAEHLSPVSAAINRIITLAPAPLLPGEKQTDYADVAVRIVKAAQPRDAIEEFLLRDVVDLTWEILRLRRVKTVDIEGLNGHRRPAGS